MDIFNVGGIGTNGGTFNANNPASGVLGKDDFLQLLVMQLRNQDPLNPTEGADFSAQLAQFSSLEQLSNIDETLQSSLDANVLLATSINNTMAATIIGKEVKARGNEISFDGESDATIKFDLAGFAKDVKLEILDHNGNVKRTVNLNQLQEGSNEYQWDGKDGEGHTLDAGNYTYRITATDADGESVAATTFVTGTISGVRYSASGPMLLLGGREIRLSDVYEILQP